MAERFMKGAVTVCPDGCGALVELDKPRHVCSGPGKLTRGIEFRRIAPKPPAPPESYFIEKHPRFEPLTVRLNRAKARKERAYAEFQEAARELDRLKKEAEAEIARLKQQIDNKG